VSLSLLGPHTILDKYFYLVYLWILDMLANYLHITIVWMFEYKYFRVIESLVFRTICQLDTVEDGQYA